MSVLQVLNGKGNDVKRLQLEALRGRWIHMEQPWWHMVELNTPIDLFQVLFKGKEGAILIDSIEEAASLFILHIKNSNKKSNKINLKLL